MHFLSKILPLFVVASGLTFSAVLLAQTAATDGDITTNPPRDAQVDADITSEPDGNAAVDGDITTNPPNDAATDADITTQPADDAAVDGDITTNPPNDAATDGDITTVPPSRPVVEPIASSPFEETESRSSDMNDSESENE